MKKGILLTVEEVQSLLHYFKNKPMPFNESVGFIQMLETKHTVEFTEAPAVQENKLEI